MPKNTPFYFIAFMALFLLSCKDDGDTPEPELLGSWKLVEVYFDPGDGSGTFQPTETEKVVSFFDDGTVMTSASFCAVGGGNEGVTDATYDEEEMTINPDCGSNTLRSLRYEILQNELIISYPCIEPCQEKYRKVLFLD